MAHRWVAPLKEVQTAGRLCWLFAILRTAGAWCAWGAWAESCSSWVVSK